MSSIDQDACAAIVQKVKIFLKTMDPDAIFIILLFLIMFILTIVSVVGLSKKIWKSNLSKTLKTLLVGLPLVFLVFAILKFNTVDSGNVSITTLEIIMFSASFLIGLNWSINLIHKESFKKIKIPAYFKVTILTIFFTALIPAIFYLTVNLFDKLDLIGSGG